MGKIPDRTISLLYIAIIGITSTCFCVNLGVLVDFKTNSYALEAVLEAILLIFTLGYCWNTRTPNTDHPILDLFRSCTLSFSHILFAGWLAISVRGSDGELLSIAGGFNWLIALWIMIVSWIKYQFVRRRQLETVSNNSSTSDLPIPSASRSSVSLDPPQPQLVHLYQPPLSLSPTPTADSTLQGDNNSENDDGLELEELPKYQRRAPAQVATIIDMSNLGTAPSEASIHVQQGGEGGQDTTVDIELEEPTETPAYSPSPALSPSSVPSSTAQAPAMDSTSNPFTPETQPGTTSTHLSVPAPSSTNEPPAYSP
ncbi:MAG: hypothetical protein J3Q66DRAFT_347981 [Benniella sp.]|nr:MAG: hypothetical protein J3Q66DRAFT_347981 [Benniella sp.]